MSQDRYIVICTDDDGWHYSHGEFNNYPDARDVAFRVHGGVLGVQPWGVAFQLGYEAAGEGRLPSANPYPNPSRDQYNWSAGWQWRIRGSGVHNPLSGGSKQGE